MLSLSLLSQWLVNHAATWPIYLAPTDNDYKLRFVKKLYNEKLLKKKQQKIKIIIDLLINKIPEILIAEIMSYSGDIEFMYKNINSNYIRLEKNLVYYNSCLFVGYAFLDFYDAGQSKYFYIQRNMLLKYKMKIKGELIKDYYGDYEYTKDKIEYYCFNDKKKQKDAKIIQDKKKVKTVNQNNKSKYKNNKSINNKIKNYYPNTCSKQ